RPGDGRSCRRKAKRGTSLFLEVPALVLLGDVALIALQLGLDVFERLLGLGIALVLGQNLVVGLLGLVVVVVGPVGLGQAQPGGAEFGVKLGGGLVLVDGLFDLLVHHRRVAVGG